MDASPRAHDPVENRPLVPWAPSETGGATPDSPTSVVTLPTGGGHMANGEGDGVRDGVRVRVRVRVRDGDGVRVRVGVTAGVAAGVPDDVGVAVGVPDDVGVTAGVAAGVPEGVGATVGVLLMDGGTQTPKSLVATSPEEHTQQKMTE